MSLDDPNGIPLLGNWFKLQFIENDGMAFGLLSEGGFIKLLLSLFRIVAVGVLFWVLVRLSKKNTKFGVYFSTSINFLPPIYGCNTSGILILPSS